MNKQFINPECRILIVDDVPKNIQVLANNLEQLGCRLAFATTGQNAIKLVEREAFDLILLDISMPVMDGYEVCRIIKKKKDYKEIPIIFITANNDKESIIAGFEVGAIDYITKPFNSSELLARVKTHLQLKLSADQIKKMNESLEEKVKLRTRDLVIANNKLEVLEKAKSNFLSLISHELRTPLIGIKGFAELLNETVENEESREFISYLMDSADRLVSFSEAALLITSLESNNLSVALEETDIKNLVLDVITKQTKKINERSLSVEYIFDADNYIVKIDDGLISKAIENIFDNSVKYSPQNDKITISIRKSIHELIISISDNGPGFTEESKKELFDFFSNSDIMHHSDGFGLGIAAVKLILDAHSGRISIQNKTTGQGAIVEFALPIE